MKIIIALALAFAVAHGSDDWTQFKARYGKQYANPALEKFRQSVFIGHSKKIEEHNQRYEQGLESFHVKMNTYGDLLPHEFKNAMNGYNKSKASRKAGEPFIPTNAEVADSVDWRTKGAVTPVKDQAQCGSCWAFSTTGSLEGQHFIKTGKLVSLSEQNLVDCSGAEGNEGCNGGLMDSAFEYIQKNGGIDTEDSYPYTAEDGSCKFNKDNVGATDSGFVDIPSGDESALKEAVATVGPVSVAIDAGEWSFQFYSGGVYYESSCSPTSLDHGVLAVGYGTENGADYWLVKNSWGAGWGEDGYIKMTRNRNNNCGIATQSSYPKV